jgi:adenine-specific DNA methylase
MKQQSLSSKKPADAENFPYVQNGIEAENHTPIYKMHRYFARRPHNVFRHLIKSYTNPGDIILDPFCGGGVTLVEGLATDRKVIAVDTNPLATFITDCQTTPISLSEYEKIMDEIEKDFRKAIGKYYTTISRETESPVEVRWYELAYSVNCTNCGSKTVLSNDFKLKRGEKIVNGKYQCQNCEQTVAAVNADRIGYEVLNVTYRSPETNERITVAANDLDRSNITFFESKNFDRLVKEYKLWYPKDAIPTDWDRQQEDCLHRKSIKNFSDFYTRRSLFANAYLLKLIQRYKRKVDPELYKILIFTFSAVVRYTNNMTVSAGNWMDGRPVAWAKHAFWIPNQFVEVNPLEYLRMRRDAIVAGLKYQKEIIANSRRSNTYTDLINGEGTHIVWTKSSEKLELPAESVHAVITDPPYGSNVQYGELSHYWLVWLQKDLDLKSHLFTLEEEILVNRKSKKKDYPDYEAGMHRVFKESFRILKPSGILTFTFNNKDIRAWYSVIKAAVEAGFTLEPDGVIYQDPIENYKNTAHTRFAGTVHGDFIYTFKKQAIAPVKVEAVPITRDELISSIRNYLSKHHSATTSELYIVCIQQLIPAMVQKAKLGERQFVGDVGDLDFTNLDRFLGLHLSFNSTKKVWEMTA